MIPTSFEYKTASSVAEAISLLQRHGGDAKLLAGGHSLIPALKLRLDNPGVVIDISKIDGMSGISMEGSTLTIGANTTHGNVAASDVVREHAPMLADAASHIGDVQVRNVGTIGGSIAHADPAADWPTVLIAINAQLNIQGPDGGRKESAEDFFSGFFETTLQDDELVTAIHVPTGHWTHSHYSKFVQPASRFALVGCAVALKVQDGQIQAARVALGGTSDHAYRDKAVEDQLTGLPADAAAADAAQAAAEGIMIMSDHFAGEAYRKQMAKVFTKRAIRAALG